MEINNELEVYPTAEDREEKRRLAVERNIRDSSPILKELEDIGFELTFIADLYNHKIDYKRAIPILLKWLQIIDNIDVKEDIVRALTV